MSDRRRLRNSTNYRMPVELRGKKYRSKRECCADYNVVYSTFLKRLDRGMTLEQA